MFLSASYINSVGVEADPHLSAP